MTRQITVISLGGAYPATVLGRAWCAGSIGKEALRIIARERGSRRDLQRSARRALYEVSILNEDTGEVYTVKACMCYPRADAIVPIMRPERFGAWETAQERRAFVRAFLHA